MHISNGFDNNLFRWMFDGLKSNNAKWNVIKMSLYPSSTNSSTLDAQCLSNMNNMIARYKKPVMICEVGMSRIDSIACESFLDDIISKTKSVANGNGLGVFTGSRKVIITGKPIHLALLIIMASQLLLWMLLKINSFFILNH